jgi:hypothetical protein
MFGRARKLPDRDWEQVSQEEAVTWGGKGGFCGRRDPAWEEHRDRSPVCGAKDPISGDPMEVPMMDASGYVMDLKSWRKYFRGEEWPTRVVLAKCERDLIKMTASNFQEFKLEISNIAV